MEPINKLGLDVGALLWWCDIGGHIQKFQLSGYDLILNQIL